MPKRALIIGITGQDGSYLAELLLEKGYEVWGTVRRSSSFNTARIDHIFDELSLVYGDLTDPESIMRAVFLSQPDEIYNLGAQSHVRVSFDMPAYTTDTVAMGALYVFDAAMHLRRNFGKEVRVYQASSSEMFGDVEDAPQDEATPFCPVSPYACAKVFAHQSAIMMWKAWDLHVSCGILFNHESERRGETFVTRKITRALGRIRLGLQDKIKLGNLDAVRDWGHAQDYVRAMWRMLQEDYPDAYVIATGEAFSVKEFLQVAVECAGLPKPWTDYVEHDERYTRPAEVPLLLGDSEKAQIVLGWKPEIGFGELVDRMVRHDADLAFKEAK